MIWNLNLIQAHRDRDVLLYTNTKRHVVASYIHPALNVGIPGHWPLLADEYPVAWSELTVPEGV